MLQWCDGLQEIGRKRVRRRHERRLTGQKLALMRLQAAVGDEDRLVVTLKPEGVYERDEPKEEARVAHGVERDGRPVTIPHGASSRRCLWGRNHGPLRATLVRGHTACRRPEGRKRGRSPSQTGSSARTTLPQCRVGHSKATV